MPSADFRSTTSPSGGGYSLTLRNSVGAWALGSNRPTIARWRVVETFVRVKGKCVYSYRAPPGRRSTFCSRPNAMQRRAERFLAKALRGANHPARRVIDTDKPAGYPPIIVQLKSRVCSGSTRGSESVLAVAVYAACFRRLRNRPCLCRSSCLYSQRRSSCIRLAPYTRSDLCTHVCPFQRQP